MDGNTTMYILLSLSKLADSTVKHKRPNKSPRQNIMGTLIGSTFTFQGNIEMVATDMGSPALHNNSSHMFHIQRVIRIKRHS